MHHISVRPIRDAYNIREVVGASTHSLSLERLNGLDLRVHVVGDGLEVLQDLLGLVDDRLVLEDGAVVRKVDCRGLRCESVARQRRIVVALPERLQSRNGLCTRVVRFHLDLASNIPLPSFKLLMRRGKS